MGGRYATLFLLMAFAAIGHFNRVSMSVAGDERLMRQFSFSETQLGMVYSSFLVAYTLAMTPGGWLIDHFGPKAMLAVMGLGSACLVATTALPGILALSSAAVLTSLFLIRPTLGLISVPLHPGAARSVSLWFPLESRSTANGVVTASALVGIALTYPVFGSLIDRFGWPGAFLIAGAITGGVTVAWLWLGNDDLAALRSEVRAAARAKRASEVTKDFAAPPRTQFGNLVLLTTGYAAVGYFQYLFFYWIKYYFEHILHWSTRDSRLYAMAPNLAMAVGMIAGGPITHYLQGRLGRQRGLAWTPCCAMAAGAVFAVAGIFAATPFAVVACFSAAMAMVGMAEGPFWTAATQVGGAKGGTSAAIFNTGGNAGGLLAPVVTPYFASFFGWRAGIALASAFCLAGALTWLFLKPIETPIQAESDNQTETGES